MDKIQIRIQPGSLIILAISLLLLPINWVLGWVLAAWVHEIGHLICIHYFRIPILSVSVGIQGAKIHSGPIPFPTNFLCTLAGPIGGLMLLFGIRLIPEAAICGLIQSSWNLIPMFSMDGSCAIKILLMKLFPQYVDKLHKGIENTTVLLITIAVIYISIKLSVGILPFLIWILFLIRNKKEKLLAKNLH